MLFRIAIALALFPALCFSQQQDMAGTEKLLEEMRGVRASLEKLKRGQDALVALARIQIDEQRVSVLESQRLQLSSEERVLEKELADASIAARHESSGSLPVLVQVSPDNTRIVQATDAPAAARVEKASRELEDLRLARQDIERRIVALRKEIATWEQRVEEALR